MRIKYKGYKIKIEQEEYPVNPRTEYDHLGTMYCFHRRYSLGDKHKLKVADVTKMVDSGNYIYLPIYLYDHSGLTVKTTPFHCPWDSGQLGYIMVAKSAVRAEYSWQRLSKERIAQIETYLRNEVEEYDQYLTGDVWSYTITHRGEYIESVGGFYGYDYCLQEAKDMVDWYEKKTT